MEERKTNKVTTCKQFEMLVSLMEKNPQVARGFMSFGNTKEEFNRIWKGFAGKLNSIGPPVRSVPEWQKVWNDYKLKIKMRLGHNKKELVATGGGCNKLFTFTALEESVIDILSLREISKASRKTFGLPNSEVVTDLQSSPTSPIPHNDVLDRFEYVDIEVEENYHISEPTNETPTNNACEHTPINERPVTNTPINERPATTKAKNSKKQFEDEKKRLLQLQTDAIQKTESHTKETARYTRKMYELKLKKFELYKENLFEKRKLKKEHLELKLRTLEYKESKLALLAHDN